MHCDVVREHVSAVFDGEAQPKAAVDDHVVRCEQCATWQTQVAALRRELRFSSAAAPNVAPAVLAKVASARPRTPWASVAAGFVAALVAGAAFVGPRPTPADVAAADVPRLVLDAQHDVHRLVASLQITEHGWHPDVPTRSFSGALQFSAPETLTLRLEDRTTYPSAEWVSNDVAVAVDGDTWWERGPAGCPQAAQPTCAGPPRTRAVVGREPFDAHGPAPLDLVVPVGSFRHAAAPTPLGMRAVDGRDAVGVGVTVAQAGPLLDGLLQAGDWRRLHPADRVELWLDGSALVPLAVRVTAAAGEERSLWAARHGYADDAGDLLLDVRLLDVEINAEAGQPPPPPPAAAATRDAGFRPSDAPALVPQWLPAGMRLHRAGRVETADGPVVDVAAWTDGRAWIKVRSTTQWRASRLFGDVGDVVRPVTVGRGTGYVANRGVVALHGADIDVVVTGSVATQALERVAASLPVQGQPVPATWREAESTSLAAAARTHPDLLVTDVEGFADPAVRMGRHVVELVYTGAGDRELVVTQAPGAALTPPLEPDVRGVAVRGVVGRYTPSLGELEWAEDGRVLSLRSDTLSLTELVAIAEGLTPA